MRRIMESMTAFRREPTLQECLTQAEEHLQKLKEEQDRDPGGGDRRATAAAERAARERLERIAQAQEELASLNERRKKNRIKPTTKEARASTTDPESQRMKMADGGYRPAFNVQFATDGGSRLIVGVEVVQAGGDQGQMAPMHEKVCHDYETTPEAYLVDGGFSVNDDIVSVERRGTTVYGVIKNAQKQLDQGKDPYAAKRRDAPEMAAFRERMGTVQGQQKYSQRAGIAEFPNAECRNRGLTQFVVRGLVKAKAQTMWHVLAHNFNRLGHLGYLEAAMAS